ncbi:MAG: TIGR01459 family HAD-type hydrolase [Alphaproteobacteria bacterium]|nr:TIGR01459 family HAD-type hydrolase [Alphaproteobacteria bacterium]
MSEHRVIGGLSEVVDDYDVFVFDVWGVIYDGGPAYPGAVEVFQELARAGKKVGVLSNSPRRHFVVEERLAKLGIPREAYTTVHTSGQEVYERLREGEDPDFTDVGRSFVDTGPSRFADLIDDLGYRPVATLAEADFVLASGPEVKTHGLDAYTDFLKEALDRDLPMICANPDVAVYDQGTKDICAGAIAQAYAEMGGKMRQVGKPHPEVYDRILKMMGIEDTSRALMIGDNLETDIPGGHGVGMHSLWILGGIHRDTLGIAPGEHAHPEKLKGEIDRFDEAPTLIQPLIAW